MVNAEGNEPLGKLLYYVLSQDGAYQGPFSEEVTRAMLAKGEINADTLIFREGDTEWKPLNQLLPELPVAGASIPVAPELPVADSPASGSPAQRKGQPLYLWLGVSGVAVFILTGIVWAAVSASGLVGIFWPEGVGGHGSGTSVAARTPFSQIPIKDLQASGHQFTFDMIQAVQQNWSKDELLKFASTSFAKKLNSGQLDAQLNQCRNLGAIQQDCEELHVAVFSPGTVNNATTQGEYEEAIQYDKGQILLHVVLTDEGDTWKLQNINFQVIN